MAILWKALITAHYTSKAFAVFNHAMESHPTSVSLLRKRPTVSITLLVHASQVVFH